LAKQLSEEERVRYEHNWANWLVRQHASPEDHSEWATLRRSTRLHVYADKVLIAWQLPYEAEEPVILNSFHVTGVSLDFERGLMLVLRDAKEQAHLIDYRPTRVAGLEVFAWTPSFNELRWTPTEWRKAASPRVLRMGLNVKQRADLVGGPAWDAQYLTDINAFRNQFPHLADQRF
jgi:hypothetical protein